MSDGVKISISEEHREKLRTIESDRTTTAKDTLEQLIDREHRHITTQNIQEQILLKLIQESDYSLFNMQSGKGVEVQDFLSNFPDREDFVVTESDEE